MKRYFGSLLFSFVLVGCGSSSSTKSGSGKYVDSAVYGVDYICGSKKGTTDVNGNFSYEIAKECRFYINNVALKKIDASILSTSEVIIQEGDVEVARFLQTLDQDGNASNGITITPKVAKVVIKLARSEQDIVELVTKLKDSVDDYNGRVVSLEEAQEHLDESIKGITPLEPIIHVSATSVRQGESITFDASSSKGDIKSYTWKEGSTILGTGDSISLSDLSLGTNIITLYIKGKNGKTKKSSVTITILAPATKWDEVTPLIDKDLTKLYVTSDDANIYLKFQTNDDVIVNDLEKVRFYLNTDNSDISGLNTDSAGVGLDYMISNEGVFHLRSSEDYTGVKVQENDAIINDDSIEVVLDKKNIEYLAEKIAVGILLMDDTGVKFSMKDSSKKYTIPNYTVPEDKVAPIITIKGDNPLTLNVGDTYVEEGATAIDVVDGVVDVQAPISDVDTSKAGVYQVKYKAEDSKGNTAIKYRVVEVKGTSSISTFEVKTIGEYNDTVAINHQNGQIWMNDNRDEGESRGCLVTTTGYSEDKLKEQVDSFCANSDFAGFSDWRAPTPLELSKFTVKMKQENLIPGMARKHCVKTLGIDSSGAVKGVNTHITNLAGLIVDGALTPSGARCVRGTIDNSTGSLSIKEENGGKVIIDDTNNSKSLMWVSEYDESKHACLAIHKDKPDDLERSKTFCEALDGYAGYSDWRDPTSLELSNFIIKSNVVYILPGYEAPCARLLAKDDGVSRVVYTRFDTTGKGLGSIYDLETPLDKNIGLRCVRDN